MFEQSILEGFFSTAFAPTSVTRPLASARPLPPAGWRSLQRMRHLHQVPVAHLPSATPVPVESACPGQALFEPRVLASASHSGRNLRSALLPSFAALARLLEVDFLFGERPTHAVARLRLCSRKRRARHAHPASLPRTQEHSAHRPVHRLARPVQRVLTGLMAPGNRTGLQKPSDFPAILSR
jgi:hypothetical protein